MASNATQIRIVFDHKFDVEDGLWRLDVGRSNIIFERMRAAILHFNHDPADLEVSQTSNRQFVIQGTHLRDVLLRSFSPASTSLHQPLQAPDEVEYVSHEILEHQGRDDHGHAGAFKDDMRIQSWARRYAQPNPIEMEGDPVLNGLNATQIRAVAMMIGERISLVQGVSPSSRYFIIFDLLSAASGDREDENYSRSCQSTQGGLIAIRCNVRVNLKIPSGPFRSASHNPCMRVYQRGGG